MWGNKITMTVLLGDCALRGLEKGITQTFQRHAILAAKRQLTGSVKVKNVKEDTSLGQDYLPWFAFR